MSGPANPSSRKRLDGLYRAARTDLLSLGPLNRSCASAWCPYRGRPWTHWLNPREKLEFGGLAFCCAECAEAALAEEAGRQLQQAEQERERQRPHRLPLGLLLVTRGVISGAQLQEALRLQRERIGRRLGTLLREMGLLSESALAAALGVQWGCPVFPLQDHRGYLECAGLLPFTLLQSTHALPVHHSASGRVLHLAFTERVDYTLLYAVEHMTGYRTVPCVAADSAVVQALEKLRQVSAPQETVFDSVRQPLEMARMAVDYARKLGAAQVRLRGAAGHAWFRFENRRARHHLLFQFPRHA
jgi:hypothetical protein